MKVEELIRKAKSALGRDLTRRQDPRYLKVMGFLVGKGLLISPEIRPIYKVKLRTQDVVWVAQMLEPRVWEVLPAAMLHYPRSFADRKRLPADIFRVLSELRSGGPGIDFMGVPFLQIKRWANMEPKDRRAKKLEDIKIMRSFRLSAECLARLGELAIREKKSQARIIEGLVLGRTTPRGSR